MCDGGADCPSRAFPDLDPAQWYHLSTDYAITNHLFIGFEDGTFRPNGQMSRAMFAMVLWRVAGSRQAPRRSRLRMSLPMPGMPMQSAGPMRPA